MFKIGATDARRLMAGDSVNLWLEKKGRKEPEDLSNELRVQMGSWTEAFNLHWFEKQTKMRPLLSAIDLSLEPDCRLSKDKNHVDPHGRQSLLAESLRFAWAYCHPDAIVAINGDGKKLALIECKHTAATGEFVRPTDVVVSNYWQFVHQMLVTGLDKVFVSVLYGNDEWRCHEVLRSEEDVATLLGAELMFLRELEEDNPPGVVTRIEPERIPGVATRRITQKEVEKANWGADFAAAAETCIGLTGAVEELETAKTILRELLPEDAERIEAFGVRVQRTKRAVTINIIKKKAA